MTHHERWRLLAGRIQGIASASHLHAAFLGIRSSDYYGRTKTLGVLCHSVLTEIQEFKHTFQSVLRPEVAQAIERLIEVTAPLMQPGRTSELKQEQLWSLSVALLGYESEITYLLSDTQEWIRVRSERAFEHLQRQIVAEDDQREKWKRAYLQGEPTCEQLGAVHLLLHGVYAFKLNAAGARTDLVYQDIVEDVASIERLADGLVLTEWKVLRTDDNLAKVIDDARRQVRRYGSGVLAGSELRNIRYLVVVSERAERLPPDEVIDNVVYRNINVAVDPTTPSRAKN